MTCDTNQKSMAETKLIINGKEIELNEFVQSFISQTVFGMVKPLRGVGEIETLVLEISNKAK